jgi:DNA-binding transcriptional LysR family regulator
MQHLTRQLVHLVAIIDYGSLSRAAEQLNLTQPALTRSVRFLENEFDGILLVRGREGARPTKLGELLYIHGKNIQASLDRVSADVKAWHQHESGHLVVGSSALPAAHFVPEAIASFLAQKPKVGLRFEVHPVNDLMTLLQQGTLDLFVGALTIERPPAGVEFSVIREERLSIICGPKHPLAKRNKIDFKEFSQYPWLLPPSDTEHRRQAEAAFIALSIANVEVAIETVATSTLVPLLTQGNYLTLHSKFLLMPDIKAGRLVALRKLPPETARSLAVFHRPVNELTPLMINFVENLQKMAL